MEEQAARWGGLSVCHVLTQEGWPRPHQMGRADLAAGLGFLGQRGCHQPSPAATNSVGKASLLCWGFWHCPQPLHSLPGTAAGLVTRAQMYACPALLRPLTWLLLSSG